MKHIYLGTLDVARIGLGCMGMSDAYTGAGTDDAESIRAIHRALDLGVTLTTPRRSTVPSPMRNSSAEPSRTAVTALSWRRSSASSHAPVPALGTLIAVQPTSVPHPRAPSSDSRLTT
jgi:hypothetical protein